MKKNLLLTLAMLFMVGASWAVDAESLKIGIGYNASTTISGPASFVISTYAEVGIEFDTPLTLSDYSKARITFSEALEIPAWGSGIKFYGDVSNGKWWQSLDTGGTSYEAEFSSMSDITDTQIKAITFTHSQETAQVVHIEKITLIKTDNTEIDYYASPYTSWGVKTIISSGDITFKAQYGTCEILDKDCNSVTSDIPYKYTITFSEVTPISTMFEPDNSSNSGFDWKNIAAGETSYSFIVNRDGYTQDMAYLYFKSAAESGYPATIKVTSIVREELPISATIGSAGYATFSSNYNLDFSAEDGLTIYTAKVNDTNTAVILTEVESKEVPANTAVVLQGGEGDYSGKVIASADALSDNELQVAATEMDGSAGNIYVLAEKDSQVGFYKLSSSGTLDAGKGYLLVSSDSRVLVIGGEDDGTTGIKNIKVGSEDNVYYNLQGQRVLYPTKGLYIVNGKKVILK